NFGEGLGKQLYEHLIKALRETEVHTLIAGIALPNEASIALHEKLGFVKVGEFVEVGKKFDNFLNVGYWQLVL
ncbi:MAG TPA: phosphinothricin acetyltransferase, partial [Gammaproteobacteria bacterium]|nr:phosphinothricin acetyltransferase [Gammaproteobacteria bacterium]